MGERRVRVIVGEGQPARKGLLRFVLDNEGYDVVAEVSSTMQLAQQLAVHRPDVVVLDEGIDVGAVGMLREVMPDAKVILVWPRGVAAVGADARLEPSEVMNALGPTVARLVGPTAPVITAPQQRPRVLPTDVIVVPEPQLAGEAEPPPVTIEPVVRVPEATVQEAPSLEAPRWVYTTPRPGPQPRQVRIASVLAAIAIAGVLATLAVVLATNGSRTVAIQSVIGDVGDDGFPAENDEVTAFSTEPGTYVGLVDARATGSIRLRASGEVRLALQGTTRIVAHGDVRARGEGVVRNVNAKVVRVRGSGTVRLTVDGSVRLRLDGSLTGRVKGTLRIRGDGTFLIHRRPL
jgi:hypothetical protein